jgi:chemotaxis response regulator CheB
MSEKPNSQQATPHTRPNRAAHRHDPSAPGENPGTLTDEYGLSAGGPDALDAAAAEAPEDCPQTGCERARP